MPERHALRGLRLADFDAPRRAAPAGPPPPTFEERLAAARAEGRAEGLAEGEARGRAEEAAGREALAEESLRLALLALDGARGEARSVAAEASRDLAALLLDALDAALPGAAAERAPALLGAFLDALGPLEETPPGAVLAVPPALLPLARERYGAALAVEADPALPEGDARVSWRRGGVSLSLAARRRALGEAIAALGLALPPGGDAPAPELAQELRP